MKPEILSIVIKAGTHPIGCSECDLLRLEGENHICVPLGRNVLGIGKDCPIQEEKPEAEAVDMSLYELVDEISPCRHKDGMCELYNSVKWFLCRKTNGCPPDKCYRLKR
jgi:hypothetical protein